VDSWHRRFPDGQGNISHIDAGRFLARLDIGQTTVVGPIYLAMLSRRSVGGHCICVFSGAGYIDVMLRPWGSAVHLPGQLPTDRSTSIFAFSPVTFLLISLSCTLALREVRRY
jgi:hypothetical protein